jgi:hypothetical protein
VNGFGDDQPQHGVADEFQPLVVPGPDAAMRDRGFEQLDGSELVRERAAQSDERLTE